MFDNNDIVLENIYINKIGNSYSKPAPPNMSVLPTIKKGTTPVEETFLLKGSNISLENSSNKQTRQANLQLDVLNRSWSHRKESPFNQTLQTNSKSKEKPTFLSLATTW